MGKRRKAVAAAKRRGVTRLHETIFLFNVRSLYRNGYLGSGRQGGPLRETLDKYDEASRKDPTTKGDLQNVRKELADTKHEILKRVLNIPLAQTAVIGAALHLS